MYITTKMLCSVTERLIHTKYWEHWTGYCMLKPTCISVRGRTGQFIWLFPWVASVLYWVRMIASYFSELPDLDGEVFEWRTHFSNKTQRRKVATLIPTCMQLVLSPSRLFWLLPTDSFTNFWPQNLPIDSFILHGNCQSTDLEALRGR